MIDRIVSVALLVLMPPLLLGIIAKVKARFAGRKGAPLLQPYYDIAKLLRKGAARSGTTTWVFVAGPAATLASVFLAGLLVPSGTAPAVLSFTGDLVLFAYLLGLARFLTTGAALDTASAFEGMGSARELSFAALTEPALFFGFLVLSRLSGSLSLSPMLAAAGPGYASAAPSLVLTALGLFIILLAETCRIPVDDPTTHLELTMIHEAMVLDHSGPLLGVIELSSALKFYVLGGLFLDVAFPVSAGSALLDWPLRAAALCLLAVAVGVVESVMARLRMRRVRYLLTASLLLCASALILLVR